MSNEYIQNLKREVYAIVQKEFHTSFWEKYRHLIKKCINMTFNHLIKAEALKEEKSAPVTISLDKYSLSMDELALAQASVQVYMAYWDRRSESEFKNKEQDALRQLNKKLDKIIEEKGQANESKT